MSSDTTQVEPGCFEAREGWRLLGTFVRTGFGRWTAYNVASDKWRRCEFRSDAETFAREGR